MSAWKTASLGEIFDIARGGSPRPIQDYLTDDPAGVNWISISDASASDKFITKTKKRIRPEGVSRSRMVKPGDFLLTNSMSFGRPYIMGTSGCIHDGWLVLSSKHGEVEQDYFFHLLGSDFIYAKFTKLAAGATVKNLNIDLVSGVEVSFPLLEEQRRIAAILDQAETLRTQRRAALAQLDSLTQALFLDMFGDVERNSKEYLKMSLGSLMKLKSGDFLPASKMAVGGQHPVYGGNGINGFHDSYMFAEPKIVIGRVGAYCGCVHVTRSQSWVTDNALYLDAVNEACDMEYLAFALTEARLNQYASQSGQPLISGARLSPIQLLVPPIALQQTFATRIQAIEALKTTHRAALAELDALFPSLQHRAFAGEL